MKGQHSGQIMAEEREKKWAAFSAFRYLIIIYHRSIISPWKRLSQFRYPKAISQRYRTTLRKGTWGSDCENERRNSNSLVVMCPGTDTMCKALTVMCQVPKAHCRLPCVMAYLSSALRCVSLLVKIPRSTWLYFRLFGLVQMPRVTCCTQHAAYHMAYAYSKYHIWKSYDFGPFLGFFLSL